MVSAVIIFFNAEKFIREAIESVFRQTYRDWELLLVDDGSTDSSKKIAKEYAARWPEKVVYLEHPGHDNRGMSASRNLGIHNSQHEYVAFLDADDVWLPHKLQEQTAILERYSEAAMVYGPGEWWHSWDANPISGQRDFIQKLGVQPDSLIYPTKLFTLFLSNEGAVPAPSAILVRRSILESIGGFEEEMCNLVHGLYDDQGMYAKISLVSPVFVSGKCWYRYRQHSEACCAVMTRDGKHYSARLTYLTWLQKYLLRQKPTDVELRTICENEILACRDRISQKPVKPKLSQTKAILKAIGRTTLPAPVYNWLRCQWRGLEYQPPAGSIRFGNLRRVTPVSRVFASDRGRCIDRYYIENFLAQNAKDIRGRVLEIADNSYTMRFGGNRVTISDVLYVEEGNPKATLIADLSRDNSIASDSFDCIIFTQTLQFIYRFQAAILSLHRILKPGGVLLATFPGISQISRYDMDRWGDYWRFTTLSARRLFEEAFSPRDIEIKTYGNVLAANAFLHGLALEELGQNELDYHDPDYELLITVRVVKTGSNDDTRDRKVAADYISS